MGTTMATTNMFIARARWALALLVCVAFAPVGRGAGFSTDLPILYMSVPLSDMDPLLRYSDGWNSTFDQSPAPEEGQRIAGRGASQHATSTQNASVTVGFYGQGLLWRGHAEDGTVIMIDVDKNETHTMLNGVSSPNSDIKIADNIDFGYHEATISLMSGSLALSQLRADFGIQSATAPQNTRQSVQITTETTNSSDTEPSFQASGQWNISVSLGGDDGSSEPFTALQGYNGASMHMKLPSKAAYVMLNGSTTIRPATYSIEVDPAPPYGPSTVLFNAQRPYEAPATFWVAPLDPLVDYTLTFNVSDSGSGNSASLIGLQALTWTEAITAGANPVSPTLTMPSSIAYGPTDGASETTAASQHKSGSSIGPIVGGVVGGVGGLAIVSLALLCLLRRRRREARETMEMNDVDPGEYDYSRWTLPPDSRELHRSLPPLPFDASRNGSQTTLMASMNAASVNGSMTPGVRASTHDDDTFQENEYLTAPPRVSYPESARRANRQSARSYQSGRSGRSDQLPSFSNAWFDPETGNGTWGFGGRRRSGSSSNWRRSLQGSTHKAPIGSGSGANDASSIRSGNASFWESTESLLDYFNLRRMSRQRAPGRRHGYEQDTDAGRLVEVVPPSYNPEWAMGRRSESRDRERDDSASWHRRPL